MSSHCQNVLIVFVTKMKNKTLQACWNIFNFGSMWLHLKTSWVALFQYQFAINISRLSFLQSFFHDSLHTIQSSLIFLICLNGSEPIMVWNNVDNHWQTIDNLENFNFVHLLSWEKKRLILRTHWNKNKNYWLIDSGKGWTDWRQKKGKYRTLKLYHSLFYFETVTGRNGNLEVTTTSQWQELPTNVY